MEWVSVISECNIRHGNGRGIGWGWRWLRVILVYIKHAASRGTSLPIFRKLKKVTLIFEKNTLILAIYGLNISFKISFSSIYEKKLQKFSLRQNLKVFLLRPVSLSLFQETSTALKNFRLRACTIDWKSILVVSVNSNFK